jgi:protein-S-isoprenylcysteine O-methyltransferase Ste14
MDFSIPPGFAPHLLVGIAFGVSWLGWLASWLIAALWASPAAKRPALREEAVYRVLTIAGGLLMFVQFPRDGSRPLLFWLPPVWLDWVLLAVVLGGMAFAWWARIHLGKLWSGRVTRKDDHRIVDTGPYGIVRHPIYTGLLVALYATALAFPGPFNFLGVAVLTIAFVVKYRLEERFLMQELGAGAYEAYRRRVPALVPFWPKGR